MSFCNQRINHNYYILPTTKVNQEGCEYGYGSKI